MKFTVFTTILGLIFSFGDMTWRGKNTAWAEQIAFVSSNRGSGKVIQEIWTIHSDGTNRRVLTNSSDLLKGWPTWSPAGEEIVFATHEEIGTLHLMDADGGNLSVLKKDYTSTTRPAWSPDGQKIAFVSYRNVVEGGIFLMNADGSNIEALTNSGEDYPSWSPDGTQLACTHFGANVYIAVINVNGGHLKLITEGFYPSWQPSGLVAVNPVERFVSTWGWMKSGGGAK